MKLSLPPLTLRLALVLLATVGTSGLLFTSCSKDPDPVVFKDYSAIDDAIIQKFLADSAITTAQKQPSGLYYVPLRTNPNNPLASRGKTASVLYTGKLMDGTVFDASSRHGNVPFTFVVGARRVIDGWDQGLPLMHQGDEGILLIPSALGYGPYGSGTIPPNAVIRFNVAVTAVQ